MSAQQYQAWFNCLDSLYEPTAEEQQKPIPGLAKYADGVYGYGLYSGEGFGRTLHFYTYTPSEIRYSRFPISDSGTYGVTAPVPVSDVRGNLQRVDQVILKVIVDAGSSERPPTFKLIKHPTNSTDRNPKAKLYGTEGALPGEPARSATPIQVLMARVKTHLEQTRSEFNMALNEAKSGLDLEIANEPDPETRARLIKLKEFRRSHQLPEASSGISAQFKARVQKCEAIEDAAIAALLK